MMDDSLTCQDHTTLAMWANICFWSPTNHRTFGKTEDYIYSDSSLTPENSSIFGLESAANQV